MSAGAAVWALGVAAHRAVTLRRRTGHRPTKAFVSSARAWYAAVSRAGDRGDRSPRSVPVGTQGPGPNRHTAEATMSTHTLLRHRARAGGISLVALLALFPAAAAAQSTNGAAEPDLTRADAMHKEADALIQDQNTKELERRRPGCTRRPPSCAAPKTPRRSMSALLAGELQHYMGSLSRAQDNLETAAEECPQTRTGARIGQAVPERGVHRTGTRATGATSRPSFATRSGSLDRRT